MAAMKEVYYDCESAVDRMNEQAFDLTMKILETGKKDVLKELSALRDKADEYAECVVSVMNFKTSLEREICKDCAKAGFLLSIANMSLICADILRPDYVG